VERVIAPSARKRRIADADILHAWANAVDAFDLADGLTMLVGPTGLGGCSRSVSSFTKPEMTMPKSLQEILDHADGLARRFEDYDPRDEDRVPISEIRLRRLRQATLARANAAAEVAEAVGEARGEGVPWSRIGETIGTSAQAAQKRYAAAAARYTKRNRPTTAGRARTATMATRSTNATRTATTTRAKSARSAPKRRPA
jgi:hypothetical protein